MKKIISVVLTMVLMVSFFTTVFANGTETGSITIKNVSKTATYEIYKLLDLESYDQVAKAYSYKANAEWATFVSDSDEYLTTDADGYVTWKTVDDADVLATFAKNALVYAKANGIDPVKSSKNDGEFIITNNNGEFTGLELGYYLIDSTVGVLCGLTTTNPDASIEAKNGIPTIDSEVKEDSTSQWGDTNTADIGQTIDYRVTINAEKGAENYVLHNTVEDGLTFNNVEKVEVVKGNETSETDLYEVKTGEDVSDEDATFEVNIDEKLSDDLTEEDQIIVSYTATLNEEATIADVGNQSISWLTYGEGEKSNVEFVFTYTYAVDIIKTNAANKLIDGAEFKIYDAANGGNEVKVVATADGYRRAKANEEGVSIVVANGKTRVIGLDSDTYYLEETVAPRGYNKLATRQSFMISNANLDATFDGDVYTEDTGVQVINKTGALFPETGGVGTVLFITIGLLVVLVAGVLLVTKKRMSMIKD